MNICTYEQANEHANARVSAQVNVGVRSLVNNWANGLLMMFSDQLHLHLKQILPFFVTWVGFQTNHVSVWFAMASSNPKAPSPPDSITLPEGYIALRDLYCISYTMYFLCCITMCYVHFGFCFLEQKGHITCMYIHVSCSQGCQFCLCWTTEKCPVPRSSYVERWFPLMPWGGGTWDCPKGPNCLLCVNATWQVSVCSLTMFLSHVIVPLSLWTVF